MKELLKQMLRSESIQILYGVILAVLAIVYISLVIYVGGFNAYAYTFDLTKGYQVTLFLATILIITSFIFSCNYVIKEEEGYLVLASISGAISGIMGIVILSSVSCNC